MTINEFHRMNVQPKLYDRIAADAINKSFIALFDKYAKPDDNFIQLSSRFMDSQFAGQRLTFFVWRNTLKGICFLWDTKTDTDLREVIKGYRDWPVRWVGEGDYYKNPDIQQRSCRIHFTLAGLGYAIEPIIDKAGKLTSRRRVGIYKVIDWHKVNKQRAATKDFIDWEKRNAELPIDVNPDEDELLMRRVDWLWEADNEKQARAMIEQYAAKSCIMQ